jgi:hypothetical protein
MPALPAPSTSEGFHVIQLSTSRVVDPLAPLARVRLVYTRTVGTSGHEHSNAKPGACALRGCMRAN